MHYLIFFGGVICGVCLSMILIPLLAMSSRASRQEEAGAALLSNMGLYPPNLPGGHQASVAQASVAQASPPADLEP